MARSSLFLSLGLLLALLASLSQAFLAPSHVPRVHARGPASSTAGRRQACGHKTTMMASPLIETPTAAAALLQQQQPLFGGSSVVVADYFSTVDEIARGIGDRPWLQYFIPTAVGMSISLAIVFSLYIAAQPYEPPSK